MASVQGARPNDYPVPFSNTSLPPRSKPDWRAGAQILKALALRSLGLFLIFDSLIHYRDVASFAVRAMQWYRIQDEPVQWLLGAGIACWMIGVGLYLRVVSIAPRRRRFSHQRQHTPSQRRSSPTNPLR